MRDADDLDRAADLSQLRRDDAVAEVQRKLLPQQVQNPDGSWPCVDCDDCGVEIPEQRLAMGRIRCVFCQDRRERGAGR